MLYGTINVVSTRGKMDTFFLIKVYRENATMN